MSPPALQFLHLFHLYYSSICFTICFHPSIFLYFPSLVLMFSHSPVFCMFLSVVWTLSGYLDFRFSKSQSFLVLGLMSGSPLNHWTPSLFVLSAESVSGSFIHAPVHKYDNFQFVFSKHLISCYWLVPQIIQFIFLFFSFYIFLWFFLFHFDRFMDLQTYLFKAAIQSFQYVVVNEHTEKCCN